MEFYFLARGKLATGEPVEMKFALCIALILTALPAVAADERTQQQIDQLYEDRVMNAKMMTQILGLIKANTDSLRDERELRQLQHDYIKSEMRTEAIYWLLGLVGIVVAALLLSLKQLIALLFRFIERRMAEVARTHTLAIPRA